MRPAPSFSWSEWANRQGGIAAQPQDARASAALARLGDPGPVRAPQPLRVLVLKTNRPCAYAWPSGVLFVTQGLMRILDDDELAGALAHEVGHLMADTSPSRAAFSGSDSDADARERRADSAGCRLLASAGLSPEFLASALAKVRDDPGTPPAIRDALSNRIQAIRAR